jgi:hypothetical protein
VEGRVAVAPVPGPFSILLGKDPGAHFLSAGAVTAKQVARFAPLGLAGIGRMVNPGWTVFFEQSCKYSFSSRAFGKLIGVAHAFITEKTHGSFALVPVLTSPSARLCSEISGNGDPRENGNKYEKFLQLHYTILTKKNHISYQNCDFQQFLSQRF